MSNKKYFLFISISHLVVILASFFPLINVDELRIGIGGAENTETYFINIVNYVQNEIYPLTGIFIVSLMIVATIGIINSMIGFFSKKLNSTNVKLAFILGFSSAIFAALLMYSNSVAFFIICASSFALISFSAIKLIRAEEKQEDSK